jgi:hypothetical protein
MRKLATLITTLALASGPAMAEPVAAGDDMAGFLAEKGLIAKIGDVTSQVQAKAPAGLVEKRGQEVADDITAFLGEQAAIVTPMWNSPVQSFYTDQIARATEKIYTKAASVKDALSEAQAATQAELDRVLAG